MSYCKTCVCLQYKGQYYPEVEQAINGGCLPCEGEIREMVKKGKFWACHDREDEKVICQGAISHAKKLGVSIPAKANIGQTFNDFESGECDG